MKIQATVVTSCCSILLLLTSVVDSVSAESFAMCDLRQPQLIHTYNNNNAPSTTTEKLNHLIDAIEMDMDNSYKKNDDGVTVTFKLQQFLREAGYPDKLYIASYDPTLPNDNIAENVPFYCSSSNIQGYSWFTFTPTCNPRDHMARIGIFLDDDETSNSNSNILPDQCVQDSNVDLMYPKYGFYYELPCKQACEEYDGDATTTGGGDGSNSQQQEDGEQSPPEQSPEAAEGPTDTNPTAGIANGGSTDSGSGGDNAAVDPPSSSQEQQLPSDTQNDDTDETTATSSSPACMPSSSFVILALTTGVSIMVVVGGFA